MTITIVILVTGMSLSAYLTFNEIREIDVDVRSFLTLMSKIRAKAVFLEYPEGCTGLTGYAIQLVEDNSGDLNSVKYYASCAEGNIGEVTEKILGNSVFDSVLGFTFTPITGSITDGEDKTVNVLSTNNSGRSKRVTIGANMDSGNQVTNNE